LGSKTHANRAPGKLKGFYACIHPDDLNFVLDTETRVKNYLQPLPLYEKLCYKLVYDYRIKGDGDGYYRLAHRVIILEHDKYGNSWMGLIISDVLSAQASDRKPRRYLINTQTGNQCLFNEEINPEPLRLLTQREEEILLLISQGLDSISISEKLFISVHTVNNHRQNILNKTGTNNFTQAYHYYKIIGAY
jgi:DNA-binding CsgD family transcriptional regulator